MEGSGNRIHMSACHALVRFIREPVNLEMIHFLASTTASIISVKDTKVHDGSVVSLVDFIKGLVKHSNVQTPTLMTTTVYLTKLRSLMPADVYGMETTRHRIFLGCLILAAKNLNDSAPLNKHWAKYTDGLLDINDVNTIERELLRNFNWDLNFTLHELITSLSYFISPIQRNLAREIESNLSSGKSKGIFKSSTNLVFQEDSHSRSSSHVSIPSLSSTNTLSTLGSTISASFTSSQCKLNVIKEEELMHEKKRTLTKPIILRSKSLLDLKTASMCDLNNKENLISRRGFMHPVESDGSLL